MRFGRRALEERLAQAEARAEEAWRVLVEHQDREIARQHELLRGPGTYLEAPTADIDQMPPGFWSEDGLVYIETEDSE